MTTRIAIVLILLASIIAMAGQPSSNTPATKPSSEMAVIFNLYDLQREAVLQSAVDALAPLVRPHDIFVLVSGNHMGAPDLALIAQWSEKLHRRFPANALWVLTSGLANVKLLAENREKLPSSVSTIIYDYEPKWDNEPEFDADFARTIDNYTEAAKLAHGARLRLVGAPTGRPLLKSEFAQYHWDYGKLMQASSADGMIVQTQTYAKKSISDFQAALAKLQAQQTGAGLPLDRIYPQITVDLNSTNGTPVAQAALCAREMQQAGFPTMALWFAPARSGNAVDLLNAIGRSNTTAPVK